MNLFQVMATHNHEINYYESVRIKGIIKDVNLKSKKILTNIKLVLTFTIQCGFIKFWC